MRRFGVVVAAALVAAGCGDGETETTTFPPIKGGAADEKPAAVGGPPTKEPLPEEGVKWTPPPPTVIAAGRTARGDPLELVLYGTEKGPCYTWMYPARRLSEGGGGCGKSIFLRATPARPIISAGQGTFGKGERQVYGYMAAEIESVVISFEQDGEEQTVDTISEHIPRDLLRQAGIKGPRGVFTAFLPAGTTPEDVTATAYDADGEPVGIATWQPIQS